MFKTASSESISPWFWIITIVILTLYNITPSIGGYDVPYYFLAGEHLWNGELDCLSTPVYPLLLKVFGVCFGGNGGIAGIIVLQSVVYILDFCRIIEINHHAGDKESKNPVYRDATVCPLCGSRLVQ